MQKCNISRCEKCTGCMACMSVCPQECIKVVYDADGFAYPSANDNKCTECGQCVNVCPNIDASESDFDYEYAYAMCADDEIRSKSSSGGAFSLIADFVLSNHGVVCGAAFVGNIVKHIAIEKKSELSLLRGSKYVQSDMTEIYRLVENFLKKQRIVLFTGTSCQCEAIRIRFAKYEKLLYVVDVLCMGVPSPKMFKEYLVDELSGKCTNINFRDKDKEGWNYNLYFSYIDEDNNKQYIKCSDSSYYKAFLNAYSLRKSCYDCKYAGKKRPSDVTIGDFWRCGEQDEKLDDKKGTSLVLISSHKGEKLIDAIKKDCKVLTKISIDKAIKGNLVLTQSISDKGRRSEFFSKLKEMSLKEAVDYMSENEADCGIVNYWMTNDNGAILTAFALQQTLIKFGYSSRLIDSSNGMIPKGIAEEFARDYLHVTSPVISENDYKKLNNSFKHFLVGSDQVFRAEWVSDKWFLDFVDNNKNKIAVSASFGENRLKVDKTRQLKIQYLLSRFNSISIREINGSIMAKKLSGKKTTNIIDPVFWLEGKEYLSKLNIQMEKEKEPYLFVYIRDLDINRELLCEKIAEKYGYSIYYATNTTQVVEFIEKLVNSNMVLTDSYHGLCFALIFNKRYKCIINEKRGRDRFDSLIEILRLRRNNFISDLDESRGLLKVDEENWSILNELINEQRGKSVDWLLNAIKNPPRSKKINILIKYLQYELYAKHQFAKTYLKSRLIYIKWRITKIDFENKLVLFGAGSYGRNAISIYDGRIAFFLDNSSKCWIDNYPVFNLKIAKKIMKLNTPIVITTSALYRSEIFEQLRMLGFDNISIYEE